MPIHSATETCTRTFERADAVSARMSMSDEQRDEIEALQSIYGYDLIDPVGDDEQTTFTFVALFVGVSILIT